MGILESSIFFGNPKQCIKMAGFLLCSRYVGRRGNRDFVRDRRVVIAEEGWFLFCYDIIDNEIEIVFLWSCIM